MELSDLIEKAIVVDFTQDDFISQFGAVTNDSTTLVTASPADPPPQCLIVVTATDQGDYPPAPGAGIKVIDVEVHIAINMGTEGQWLGNVSTLSLLAERVEDRLQSALYSGAGGDIVTRLQNRPGLKIFGIISDKPKRRGHLDLTRERYVSRDFVCAQTS